jgi:hypothetical protein
MLEVLNKLNQVLESAQAIKQDYQVKLSHLGEVAKLQGKKERELEDKEKSLQERESKVEQIEITTQLKKSLSLQSEKLLNDRVKLDEDIRIFKESKDKELAEINSLRNQNDLAQKSLNDQKKQLEEDKRTYKQQVLKEVAQDLKDIK